MELFKSLFHVTIYSNDIDKTIEFYEKLGFRLIFSIGEEGAVPWNYYMKIANGQYLEIQPCKGDNPHPHPDTTEYHFNQTVWHFALETPDIENMINTLISRGIELYDTADKNRKVNALDEYLRGPDGCKICWVFDPDGTPIELMEQSQSSLQHIYDPESYK